MTASKLNVTIIISILNKIQDQNSKKTGETDKKIIMELIIGGGTYGKLAFDKIQDEGGSIVVIDEDPYCIVQKEYHLLEVSAGTTLPEGTVFIKGGVETAAWIVAGSSRGSGPRKYMQGRIFPTAPVHIAAGIISEICRFVPDPEGASSADLAVDPRPTTQHTPIFSTFRQR